MKGAFQMNTVEKIGVLVTVRVGKYASGLDYLDGRPYGAWAQELAEAVVVRLVPENVWLWLIPAAVVSPGSARVLPSEAYAMPPDGLRPARPEAVLALAEQWVQPAGVATLGRLTDRQGLLMVHPGKTPPRRDGRSLRIIVPDDWLLVFETAT